MMKSTIKQPEVSIGSNILEPVMKFGYSDFLSPTVVVVGCGGTGGYVAGHLARLATIKKMGLIFVDGDIVEQKNLERQHFITSDIGKNKAVALAERYNGAFGLNITAHTKYLEDAHAIQNLFYNTASAIFGRNPHPAILIGCVDNNATRIKINEWFNYRYNENYGCFWIDSGNEETTGQVSLGFTPQYIASYNVASYDDFKKEPKYYSRYQNLFKLPSIIEKHPDILKSDDKLVSEQSCAERAISAPQNIMTNITASTLIMNYVSRIINGVPISNHYVEFSNNNVFNHHPNKLSILQGATK